MDREIKRRKIIAIYVLLLTVVVGLLYWSLKSEPTCFDGRKNQGEEGIDCGGLCDLCKVEIKAKDLLVPESVFIYGGPEKYDVLAKVRNPNDKLGSPKFSYKFTLKNAAGNVLAEKEGKNFILPSETKNIIETNLETQESPQSLVVEIKNAEWINFLDYAKAEYESPRLNIYKEGYLPVTSGIGFGNASGLLRNESPFDYHIIYVSVVLRDFSGDPIAVNKMEVRDVGAKEERAFQLFWPNSFSGVVEKIEVEAKTDVFDPNNFIEKKLPGGRFQGNK